MDSGNMDCSEMADYYREFDGVSESEEEKSRLRWVVDAGLSLGKKIVITGIVVTSAPLILPPLVVVSALGCAFSVPFGVIFASYACTQKLMSKLLPPPPMLSPYDENEEERKDMEDVKNEIEFLDYDEGLDGGDGFEIGYLEEHDEGFVDSDEIGGINEEEIEKQESGYDKVYFEGTKIDGYGGDVEFQGQNNVGSSEKVDTLVVNEDEKDDAERIESEDLLQVEGDGTLVENEDKKDVSERIGNEGLSQVQGDTLVENEGEKNVLETKEGEELFKVQDVNEDEKNISDRIEGEDLVKDQSAEVEMTAVATVRVTDKDEKRRKGKRGKKKTVAAFKVPEKTKEPEVDNRHEKTSIEDKRVITEKNDTSSEKNLKSGEKLCPEVVAREESIELVADKEQVGEEKRVVLEGENLDAEQVSVKNKRNEDVKNVETSSEKEDEPVMLKEVSDVISIETNGETMSYKSTTVVVTSEAAEGNSVKIATDDSVEGMHDDEEIWKKIDAIRVIVGFKAPRRASYFEELKAMYIFTGIEPPSDSSMDYSSSDSSADFQNKLRFLMSVIGLK